MPRCERFIDDGYDVILNYRRAQGKGAANLDKLMPPGGTICAIFGMGSHTVLPIYPLGLMKAALENLVRYMEVDLYDKGIRVNGVCGGMVKSGMLPYLSEMWPDMMSRMQSSGRRWALEPVEIANVVAFLASDRSTEIRGQILIATGGIGLAA